MDKLLKVPADRNIDQFNFCGAPVQAFVRVSACCVCLGTVVKFRCSY